MKMLTKLIFAAFAVLGVAMFCAATWLAWPSEDMIAPEKTGEIGFMGMVVVAKYIGYTVRVLAAVLIGAVAFTATVTGGILVAERFSHSGRQAVDSLDVSETHVGG
ncbi:hypothetical protein [Neorhodopirellula lusitana]|uniref:hypothetical protein n=1 Tax=Neorhodopirellula lusitana TaxID=445327 RepID=UPI00384FC9C4